MVYYSVKHDKVPETKDYVRANSKCSSFVIESDGEGGTKYCQVAKLDIGGKVPSMIVNSMSCKMPKDIRKKLEKGCKEVVCKL